MQFLTIVNRTSKNLKGVWDGKHYDITPGRHQFPEIQALKFKEQNPIMGSEDPGSLERLYLIGIEEQHDDCSPIEQSASIERWDRSKIGGDVKIVQGQGYLRAEERHTDLPSESAFVKP